MNVSPPMVSPSISQKPSEFARTSRALVRIHNQSQYDIDVPPQPPAFIKITPTVEILKPLNAEELASKIEKKNEIAMCMVPCYQKRAEAYQSLV